MELLGSLFVVLALVILVALFVGRPLLVPNQQEDLPMIAEEDHLHSSLLAERDRILNALQDLDFDNALGKIPAEDYPVQRAALMRTGALTLQRIDAIERGVSGTSAGISDTIVPVEERLEAAIAARRADGLARQPQAAPRNGGTREDALEQLIADRKRQRKETSAGFCPKCGKPVQKSDQFCARCGTTL